MITEATLKLLPLPPYRACLAVGLRLDARRRPGAARHPPRRASCPARWNWPMRSPCAAAQKRTGSERLARLPGPPDRGTGRPGALRARRDPGPGAHCSGSPAPVRRARLGAAECEQLWQIRREFSYALRDTGLTKLNEDIVVPRGRLEDLFRFTARLAEEVRPAHRLLRPRRRRQHPHQRDGGLRRSPGARTRSEAALDELFRQVVAWGGVITGEHGIGLAKKRWWPLVALGTEVRALHRRGQAGPRPQRNSESRQVRLSPVSPAPARAEAGI